MESLPRSFFCQPVVHVAQALLGQILVVNGHQARITETEAYSGSDDPASHAFRGKTPRSTVMFGPPGYSYIYLIYGMHHCLNIVTGQEGEASAVLIRGAQLLSPPYTFLNGPGKLCTALSLTRQYNGVDLIDNPHFFCTSDSARAVNFMSTPRVGIRQGTEKLWRFIMTE